MDPNIKVIMAYAIIAMGPAVGSYLVVKNSSKLTGAVMNGFNRVGRGIAKAANGFAQRAYKNSTFGGIMASRRNARDANAQQRTIERMGKKDGKIARMARWGMTGNTRQLMDTQINDANDKIMDSRVKYAMQNVRKEYNAKNRSLGENATDPETGQYGIQGLVRAARKAADEGDQVAFNAYAAHAASGGADEYKLFHTSLQDSLDMKKHKKMFDNSMGYTYSTMGGELAPKSPGVASVLQTGNSGIDIQNYMENDPGLREMYSKVGADKHASYSSDQAKVAAQYANDDVLRELVENPGGKHSLSPTARKAYTDAYNARGLRPAAPPTSPPPTAPTP